MINFKDMEAIKATYRQPCNWSRFSIVVTVVFIVTTVLLCCFDTDGSDSRHWAIGICRYAFVLVLLAGLYYCPRSVEITPSRMIIRRLLTKKYIPVGEIIAVAPYQRTMNFVRVCGSGGVLGFWGWFRNQELGRFFVYATTLKQLVVVALASGRTYVVSCGNAQEMAAQITLRMHKM